MLVSVCTTTYNRRPFIPFMMRCFQQQDYSGNVEWVIVDDGTDPIYDLVKDLPFVKYIRLETKYPLGKKRNIMHSHCLGDILVYMDDDDFYPPQRISHAVDRLMNSDALCAGSSKIHVYFDSCNKVIECGPYGPNHATAGTFAMKRELLTQTSYDERACFAEEQHFLKNYTIPFVQLDPMFTILVVAHQHNTYDKHKLLNDTSSLIRYTDLTISDFIKDDVLYDFFSGQIHELLSLYEVGKPHKNQDIVLGNRIFSVSEIGILIQQQHEQIQSLQKKVKVQEEVIRSYRESNPNC